MSSRLPRFIIRRIRNRNPRHARDFHRLHKRIVAGFVSLLLLVAVGGLAEGLMGTAINSLPTRGLSADATGDLLGGLAGVAVNTLLRTNTNATQGYNPNQTYVQVDQAGRPVTDAYGRYIPCPQVGIPCSTNYQQLAGWQQVGVNTQTQAAGGWCRDRFNNLTACSNVTSAQTLGGTNNMTTDALLGRVNAAKGNYGTLNKAVDARANNPYANQSAYENCMANDGTEAVCGKYKLQTASTAQSAYEACRQRAALNPDDASIRCEQPRSAAPARKSATQAAAPTLSKDQICALNEDYIGSMEDQTIRFIQGQIGTDVDGDWGQLSRDAYALYCHPLSKDQICALNQESIGSMETQTIRTIQDAIGTDVDGDWGTNSKTAYAAYCGTSQQSSSGAGSTQQQEAYEACRARAAANPDDASIRCEDLKSAAAGTQKPAQTANTAAGSTGSYGTTTCTVTDVTDTINAQGLRAKCTQASLQALAGQK